MSRQPRERPDEGRLAVASRSRRRLHRRRGVVAAALAGVVILAFVLWWFQPQALLFDNVVDEEFPGDTATSKPDEKVGDETDDADAPVEEPDATSPDATSDDQDDVSGEPVALVAGSFESRNRYTVTGTATVYELEDGERILRLEDFASTNGPDLFVYLTLAGTADEDSALGAEFVDLGVLRGNIGSQNYVIPSDVDLDHYTSAVIWCRRFASSFGVADLA